MKGDQDPIVNRSMAWATSVRLFYLSSNREDPVLVRDEPPNGITPLEKETVGNLGRFKVTSDLRGRGQVARSPTGEFRVGARRH